jgi:lysophospholipase L1-like esterase
VIWLSDLQTWAEGIAAILKPGGRFVVIDFHPVSLSLDDDWTLRFPYSSFDGSSEYIEWQDGVGDYVAAVASELMGHDRRDAKAGEDAKAVLRAEERRRDLLRFTRHVIRMRHRHPALRRRKYFQGRAIHGLDALLGAIHPAAGIRVINMGTSGHTVRDLAERWETDVFDLEPDYVSIMIGANDVWRQFDSPLRAELHVPLDEYERVYEQLITATLPRVRGLILITPFYLEANREDPMRAMMDEYGEVVRRLAVRHETPLVDSQAAFDELLEVVYPAVINWDRVHLNHTGAMVLARALAKSIGVAW